MSELEEKIIDEVYEAGLSSKVRELLKENVSDLSSVLETKKANCMSYSQVYWIICKKLGLDVGVVYVYSDENNKYLSGDKRSHACNVLTLSDGTEILVDFTYNEFNIKHREAGDKMQSKEEVYGIFLVNYAADLKDSNKFKEAEDAYKKALKISIQNV